MGQGDGATLALPNGRSLSDNLAALKASFPLNSSGYFGNKGHGRSGTRNIEADSPLQAAWDFAHTAAYSPMATTTIAGKGVVWTMRDGNVVSHRFVSSSADHSPVVELKVHGIPGLRSQKIHFVKKGK